jgi:hypothetical protein
MSLDVFAGSARASPATTRSRDCPGREGGGVLRVFLPGQGPAAAVGASPDRPLTCRCRRGGGTPGTRPGEVRWGSCRTSPIVALGHLAKPWRSAGGHPYLCRQQPLVMWLVRRVSWHPYLCRQQSTLVRRSGLVPRAVWAGVLHRRDAHRHHQRHHRLARRLRHRMPAAQCPRSVLARPHTEGAPRPGCPSSPAATPGLLGLSPRVDGRRDDQAPSSQEHGGRCVSDHPGAGSALTGGSGLHP